MSLLRIALAPTLMAIWSLPLHADDSADEQAVYESLSEVTVGRVFFSASQRNRLDAMRSRRAPVRSSARSERKPGSREMRSNGAGYFIDASGQTWVYRQGEFVAVSDGPGVKFPAEVKVIRSTAASKPTEDQGDASE